MFLHLSQYNMPRNQEKKGKVKIIKQSEFLTQISLIKNVSKFIKIGGKDSSDLNLNPSEELRVSVKNQKENFRHLSDKNRLMLSLIFSLIESNSPSRPTPRTFLYNKRHYQNDSVFYGGA
jgi:hypothetical protein